MKIVNVDRINEVEIIKTSKTFQIGDLFFRSVKKPYKLVTFPVNFLRILLEK